MKLRAFTACCWTAAAAISAYLLWREHDALAGVQLLLFIVAAAMAWRAGRGA